MYILIRILLGVQVHIKHCWYMYLPKEYALMTRHVQTNDSRTHLV